MMIPQTLWHTNGMRAKRKAAKVPLKEMAYRCGMTLSALSNVEAGRTKSVPPKVAEEYAKLDNV